MAAITLLCFSDFVIQSINISTIASEASATGSKENSHQKKHKKTAINNTLLSLLIQIYDKFFTTSNFKSRNLWLLECQILVKNMVVGR